MTLHGVGDIPAIIVPCLILSILSLAAVAVLMRNVDPRPHAGGYLDLPGAV